MMLRSDKKDKHAANLQLVKETNLALIFNLINKHQPVSRAELAHITRLSPTTVSSLTEELIESGVVVETGAVKTSAIGRKPIMLEINSGGGFVASVEMVEDGFFCTIYDLKYTEVDGGKNTVAHYTGIGTEIVKEIEHLLVKNNIKDDKLLGICIGIPGLLDLENNRVISSTVIPIDESNNFYSDIKRKYYDIPVMLGNESCFCAYAEKEFGMNGNIRNLVFIDINIGIGAGIILDGQIYTGSFGLAGEVGHISIDFNGPRCKCGNRGCLETLASIPALSQKILFAMMSGRETIVKDILGNDYNKIGVNVIKEAMDKEDGLVLELVDDTAEKLAHGINNIINLFNPEVIVVGGEIAKLGDVFLQRVDAHLKSMELKPNIDRIRVKYSGLGDRAGTLGGAKYVLDNVFKMKGLLEGSPLYD